MTTIQCTSCGRSLTPEQASAPCPVCGGFDRTVAAPDGGLLTERAKKAVAEELAALHYHLEDGLTGIYRILGTPEEEAHTAEPIKLLQVNALASPYGVRPLFFRPAPETGFYYPTVLVQVTPDEFEKLRRNELRLPEGWAIGEEIPKPPDPEGRNGFQR